MEKVWHVGLISFKPDVSVSAREAVLNKLKALGEDCGGEKAGILFWATEENMDLRKNIHLVELSAFKNYASLQALREHPKHKEFGEMLSKIADWWTGDIYAPMSPV